MKAFFKEFVKRLVRPTVYAPIIGFIITVAVASGLISIGEDETSKLIELIVQIFGAILAVFGVTNNPTDKEHY